MTKLRRTNYRPDRPITDSKGKVLRLGESCEFHENVVPTQIKSGYFEDPETAPPFKPVAAVKPTKKPETDKTAKADKGRKE